MFFSSCCCSRCSSLASFDRKEKAHLGAINIARFCGGAAKIAAATAENRAILVHSGVDMNESRQAIQPLCNLSDVSSLAFGQDLPQSMQRLAEVDIRKPANLNSSTNTETLLRRQPRLRHCIQMTGI